MLNVNRLRIFSEVAARGSFSAAADALSYTQSAVSQAVATLEAELGVALIERERGGIRPTEAGLALIGHADGILARLDAAEQEVAAIAGLRGGRLRIASFPTAGATLMPLAVAEFSAVHPEVELSLAEGEPEEIGPRLRAGEFDLVLLFEFRGVNEKLAAKMRRTQLLEDPMYLALPRDHPLTAKPVVILEDLRDQSWIQTAASSPCARHVVRCCHAAGFEPAVSFESDDYLTVQGLVAAGVGVALIPQLALSSVRDDIAVRPLHPQSPVRKVIAATGQGNVPPSAEAMLKVLGAVAERYRAQADPENSRPHREAGAAAGAQRGWNQPTA
jgi:DNA-binding transcriptional LysR family regulator